MSKNQIVEVAAVVRKFGFSLKKFLMCTFAIASAADAEMKIENSGRMRIQK